MKFWNKICGLILFLLFTYYHLPAQHTFSLQLSNSTFLLKKKLKIPDTTVYSLYTSNIVSGLQNSKPLISENFYTTNYSFFCREELKIEKSIRFPLRFRLGSLQQCKYYEGKK